MLRQRSRRDFLVASISTGMMSLPSLRSTIGQEKPTSGVAGEIIASVERDVPTKRFDGETCWAHPRTGLVPGAGNNGGPRIVMTVSTVDLLGSDVFRATYGLHSDDFGRTWSIPQEIKNLAPRTVEIDGKERPLALCDFSPRWHTASKTLLGTGQDVLYTPEWVVQKIRPRHATYAVYDPATNDWSPWQNLVMPEGDKFRSAGAGSTQRLEMDDGAILLPIYFQPPGKNYRTTIVRCSFDGRTLSYVEHGDELALDDGKTRGLFEPSITRFGDRYFLTLRNDERGYVTSGKDGLHFDAYRPWTFDDGADLGNYNTQQHWVTHSDGLFLAYTRRGANNDHVFRHRAPLFLAQVDPKRLCVIRSTERSIMPERGARLGNFGVTDVSPEETWVTDSEWMQPKGCEKHGSDGSVWAARIRWSKVNRLVS